MSTPRESGATRAADLPGTYEPPATAAAAPLSARAARIVGALLVAGGALAVALAFAVDVGGGEGAEGFGALQMAAAVAGLAALVAGLDLGTAAGAAAAAEWRRAVASASAVRLARWGWIAAQALLLVLVVQQFRLESPVFFERVMVLALLGFVASSALPQRLRLRFFAALSLLGVPAVFGFADAAWLLGVGVALVAICHLPIPFAARVALLVGAGGALAALRAGAAEAPWGSGVWPILASLFMFRLILYMYDLRHMKERPSAALGISYFFLLPNLAFPLFPTVDFATYRRSHFDRDALAIYEEGVAWIFRGVTHLLLYRAVYKYMVIAPAEVASVYDLARYVVANFLLYLRVSGTFHVIVGILHLFGFRLPETHRFFYLSSGFTDLWRRINIYWKDFMMKVVYYPAYFRLRKAAALRGSETAVIIVSTVFVFAATWFLHAYQWFWILGTFLLSWTDVAFWSVLAVGLIGSTLLELRRGRVRSLGATRWTARLVVRRSLQTAAMFVVMSLLWALWTSHTFDSFAAIFQSAGFDRDPVGAWTQVGVVLAAVLAGALLFTLAFRARVNVAGGVGAGAGASTGARAAVVPVAAGAILLLGHPSVSERYPLEVEDVVYQLRLGELNKRDAALLQQGYYENLTGVTRFSGQLWELQAVRPQDWTNIGTSGATRWTGDFLRLELLPSVEIMYRGAPFRTNRWGMRDRDYELLPPPGTVRIALLGPSYVMGDGVRDEEVFERLVEERLNRELSPRTGVRYEILNFAVSRYRPSQQLRLLETKVMSFRPDAVLFISHPTNDYDIVTHLATSVTTRVEVPYEFMTDIARRAAVDSTMSEDAAVARLGPFREELLGGTYRRIAEVARAGGARAAWVLLEMPEPSPSREEAATVRRLAATAGFDATLDLERAYAGHDLETLQIASFDHHPNAKGHQLIADALYEALVARPALLTRREEMRGSAGGS
jgi:hypothetical protein